MHRGHWLQGCSREYAGNPVAFLTRMWETHGDYCTFRLNCSKKRVLLSHPHAAERMLLKNVDNYPKPDEYGIAFGDSLLTKPTKEAVQARKKLVPHFRLDHAAYLMEAIEEQTQKFMNELESSSNRLINVNHEMQVLSLRIATQLLFGRDLSGEEYNIDGHFQKSYQHMYHLWDSPVPWRIHRLSPHYHGWKKAIHSLRALFADLIEEHANPPEGEPIRDMLSAILSQTPEEGQDLESDISLILAASYQTVTAILASTVEQMALHPELQEEAYREASSLLGSTSFSYKDLPARLPVINAAFNEGLRLFPSFNISSTSVEDDEIDGYHVPAGSHIILFQRAIHRHPEFWDDPESFKPERFLNGNPIKHKFAFVPFASGPRVCMGKSVAMAEVPMVVAHLLNRFEVFPQEDGPNGMVRLKPRH